MTSVLYEVRGSVATVTLNRPGKRNALTIDVVERLRGALSDADGDAQVGAIVLTAADPAFCAGLDLQEVGESGGLVTRSWPEPWPATRKPLIAAVNGAAVTGGLELVLRCDVVIASDRAVFGDTHTRVGVMPGWGLTVLLPRRVGLGRAIEMSLTGAFVGAQDALAYGLVDHVVPHDQLLATADGLAGAMAEAPPEAAQTLLASYRAADRAAGTQAALAIEAETAAAWQSGVAFEEVESRRASIIARGRAQTQKPQP